MRAGFEELAEQALELCTKQVGYFLLLRNPRDLSGCVSQPCKAATVAPVIVPENRM